MGHRIVRIEAGGSYSRTEVSFDRSLVQIQALLEKHKCSRVAAQKDMRGDIPTTTLVFEKAGLPYIIEFPIIYERMKHKSDSQRQTKPGEAFEIGLEISIGKRTPGGVSVDEFVKMTEIAKLRYGGGVMIKQPDTSGRMHLSKEKKHLGFIDLKTGSLVWDDVP